MPNTPGATLVGSPIEISNQTDTPIARANQITVNAAAFSGNLSPTDTLVQTALATIDALSIGGSVLSFKTISCPAGTNPVADSSTDTLSLTSTGSTLTITGNSTTDTVNFEVNSIPTGSVTGFDEAAQDAVGNIFVDSASIDFTYSDATPSITAVITDTTVTPGSYGSATQVATFTVDQKGRLTAAGNTTISVTSSAISDFTEAAQDAVGASLTDTSSIDFTYNDGANTISAVVLAAGVDHNSLANLTTGDPHTQYVKKAGDTMTGDLVIDNQKSVKFRELTINGTNSITTQAPASLSADWTLTFPPDDGSSDQFLRTDGSGVTTWVSVTSSLISDFNEAAQDAVGGILTDSASIDFTYNDGANTITAVLIDTAVTPASYGSATQVATFTVDQKGRLTAAGNTTISVTSSAVSDFTEAAQDAVGAALTDTSSIDFTYSDAGNTISAVVLPAGVDHNSLANLTTGDPHTQYVKKAGDTMTGNLVMDNQKAIVFRELTANGTNTVTIQAPASLSADYTLTLPPDDGTASQVLTTDGSGVLSWSTAGGGSGDVLGSGNGIADRITKWLSASTITVTNWSEVSGNITSLTGGKTISVPGAGSNSEIFGASTTSAGSNNVVVGKTATGPNSDSVIIGYGATNTGAASVVVGAGAATGAAQSVSIGNGASVSDTGGVSVGIAASCSLSAIALGQQAYAPDRAIAIGYSTLTDADCMAIGYDATASTGTNNIAIGKSASVTASNAIAFGYSSTNSTANKVCITSSTAFTDFEFGGGVSTAPGSFTLHPLAATGTNTAGASVTLYGGKATGNAAGGSLIFQTSIAGASGTTVQSLGTALTIDGKQNVVIGGAALSTSATDGFLYIDACAGTPAGTPSTFTGRSPLVMDTSNDVLYAYSNSAWVGINLTTTTYATDTGLIHAIATNLTTNGVW
jgi:hypothetical protein